MSSTAPLPTPIPPTKTQRLLLREVTPSDVATYLALEGREDVVRYQTYTPWSPSTALQKVHEIISSAAAVPRTIMELAVEHSGVFVGRVGARVHGEPHQHADVWFSFLPEYQGRGFGTEAVRALITLLGGAGVAELEIECDPRNEGSWRLAERLGFERISLTEKAYECKGEWVGSLVYRRVV